MLRKILYVVLALISASALYAQSGSIKGTVTDAEKNEPVPFANVVVERNGNQITGTITDVNGNYTLKPVPAGRFTVLVSSVGYQKKQINGVLVNADKIRFLDIEMASTSVKLDEIEVVEYKVPLIDKDNTQTGGTVTSEDIEKMSGRSAESVAATVGGVYQEDGEVKSVRGAREEATTYYIDGIKVRGSKGLPKSAIEEVSVVTGGLAAKYGDATGGIISITTKGPSRQFFGSAELMTSVDGYFDNLAAVSLSGPLFSVKTTDPNDPTKVIKNTIAGYFLSAEATYTKDSRPFATDIWKVKDEVIDDLVQNPIVPDPYSPSTILSAEYLDKGDFEKIDAKENADNWGGNFSGKIDIKPFDGANITLGGNLTYNESNAFVRSYQFMNSDQNPQTHDLTWRAFGRYTQRFKSTEASEDQKASLIKNAYFTAQVDWTQQTGGLEHAEYGDDLFKYGYYGEYQIRSINSYQYGHDTASNYTGYIHDGFIETLDTVLSTPINEAAGRYNELYYENYNPANNIIPGYPTTTDLLLGGGYLNGDGFSGIQLPELGSIAVPGAVYNDYYKYDQRQLRATISGAADIGNHEISVGGEFEMRFDRQYRVSPTGLWSLARGYMNDHISELDLNNPEPGYVTDANGNIIYDPYGNPVFNDTVNYPRLLSTDNQYLFDLKFRQANSLEDTEWVNIDGYDPEDMDIAYFSADELYNNGNSLVSYYGYNHKGEQIDPDVSFNDFFTDYYIDEVGNRRYKREIPVYQPIYAAAYIQDKFAFKDLVFNVGLRLDYYDLNQKVLEDKFTFFEAYQVGDAGVDQDIASAIPGNIPDGATIYVQDYDAEAGNMKLNGFRDGETWYTATGEITNSPGVIEGGKGIQPYLKNPAGDTVGSPGYLNSFTDYNPQFVPMPRVSFSFPISDEALFFAHYDILTKRPSDGYARLSYINYLTIFSQSGSVLSNPDLRPEKTIDYELGFQQKLGKTSSLKISAFYREMRDMIQVRAVEGAFPVDYLTYDNLDFGTVKGFTTTFDLRRTNNVSLRASYTLQFAKGTGSDPTTALALVQAGQPNLRTIKPLDFDQTHAFVFTLDYRFSDGDNYNGPKLFGQDILANAGVNIVLNTGSGTPYSLRNVASGTLIGRINGSRMPWMTTMNMRVDKDFRIKLNKGEEDNNKHININVYADISNVLNTMNVTGVYSKTGNPDDNGYLTYAGNQSEIESRVSPDSFRNYYRLYMDNPYNYNMPRRFRVGVMVSF
ncbi:carboxypeptidase-like regulatory domain-containing protein [Salinivirga cyanobacteriivorans]